MSYCNDSRKAFGELSPGERKLRKHLKKMQAHQAMEFMKHVQRTQIALFIWYSMYTPSIIWQLGSLIFC